ncbi:phage major capsid protein [Gaopeijia maritima]|uniref:phage major capsid protein n=1 Tax=Gaopeijia maritima TaxID=3119007 RepID=UPI0032721B71
MGIIRDPERLIRALAGQPWAILPQKAREIVEFLELRADGVERSASELEAITGRQRKETMAAGAGVAILPLFGVIAQRVSGLAESSGGASLERFCRNFDDCLANEDIGTIVLQVDSPGGSVDGIAEAASRIHSARGQKRVIAVADPLMASAAYWIGSAADEVVVSPSGQVGSIGVIAVHSEWSRYAEEAGLTTTVFKAGRFKGEGNPHEPLTDDARAHIQETIEDYMGMFVDAVALHRGVSAEDVRSGMGEGRVLTAERAVQAGLADRVATMDEVLADLGIRRRTGPSSTHAQAFAPAEPTSTDADRAASEPNIHPDSTAPSGQEAPMADDTAGPQAEAGAPKPNPDPVALERQRVSTINDLCDMHTNLIDARQRQAWVREGATVQQVAEQLAGKAAAKVTPVATPQPSEEAEHAAAAPAIIRRRSSSLDDEPGMAFGRFCRAIAAGNGQRAEAERWANENGYTDIAAAMRSTKFDAGGAFVPENYIPDVIELLRPASAIRRLMPTVIPLEGGNASIPKLTGGATAYYKGEGQRGTASEAKTGRVNLVGKELMAFVPLTSQLMKRSSPQADMVVRDDSIAALAQRSDLAFIRGDGTEFTPKGLRHQAPAGNIIPANATVNLANVTVDLGKAVLALQNNDVRMIRPGWVMSPRTHHYLVTVRDGNGNYAFRDEMTRDKTLWGYPFSVTSQVPINLGVGGDESELYFADFADVVIGEEENITVDVFREATYWDGAAWQSAAQNNEVVLRFCAQHDLGVRHDESVAVLTEVKWGA